MVSLDIRKPMDVMGGALSQSPVCAAFEAKIRALSIWDVQLAKSMLKDCSVIRRNATHCVSPYAIVVCVCVCVFVCVCVCLCVCVCVYAVFVDLRKKRFEIETSFLF